MPLVPIPSLIDAESVQLAAEMVAAARAMAAVEEIDTFTATGWLPDAFFDALNGVYDAYEKFIAHNIAASRLRIQCAAGCARCCRQMVHGVYGFEIVNLYRALRTRPDYERIHSTFLEQARQFEKMRDGVMPTDTEKFHQVLRRYAASGNWCALLVDNKCSAYAQRPVPCRMYHSLTDPILCVTPIGTTFNLEPPRDAADILDALDARLAVPFSQFLASGLVAFGAKRQFAPWGRSSIPERRP